MVWYYSFNISSQAQMKQTIANSIKPIIRYFIIVKSPNIRHMISIVSKLSIACIFISIFYYLPYSFLAFQSFNKKRLKNNVFYAFNSIINRTWSRTRSRSRVWCRFTITSTTRLIIRIIICFILGLLYIIINIGSSILQ